MRPFLLLIPLLPLLGFLFNFTIGVRLRPRAADGESQHGHGQNAPHPLVGLVGAGSVLLSFLVAARAALLAHATKDHAIVETLYSWLRGGLAETAINAAPGATSFSVEWAYLLDPLSSVMVLFVTFVGFLIHVYSIGYMGSDPGYARFMAYLNLFMFAMLTLVLAANYAVLFVGWEGVGLCSYLLIGFWFEKSSASDAGRKAFIVNRVGDAGFLLGMFLVFVDVRDARLPRRDVGRGGAAGRDGLGRLAHADRAPALRGRRRQERPAAAARVAARRDGGPDSGLRADPRRHDGDRRRLPGRALGADLRARAKGHAHGGARRRGDGIPRSDDRARPERHQARARVLDDQPARLHVPRLRRRGLRGRHLPRLHARLLQGAACSWARAR